jgi:hypothetical protein
VIIGTEWRIEVSDSTMLPNRAGQAARKENRCKRIEQAARKMDLSWNAWMTEPEEKDEGFEEVLVAIKELREALDC